MIWPGAAGEKLESRVASSIPTPSSSMVMRMPSGSRRTATARRPHFDGFSKIPWMIAFSISGCSTILMIRIKCAGRPAPTDRDAVFEPQILDFHIKLRVLEFIGQGDHFAPLAEREPVKTAQRVHHTAGISGTLRLMAVQLIKSRELYRKCGLIWA